MTAVKHTGDIKERKEGKNFDNKLKKEEKKGTELTNKILKKGK